MRNAILFAIAVASVSSPIHGEPLAVGSPAPALVVKNQNGEDLDLGAAFQKGVTLVYFYPKADTPGCTKQACNLRDFRDTLRQAGIRVIGVSGDEAAAQKAFDEKYKLDFELVADASLEVINAFGVPLRLGKFASRQSFLIRDGKIIWHQPNANPSTQAEDALAALAAAK